MKKFILILVSVILFTSCMKTLEVYTITAESNDVTLGTVSGSGTYTAGTTAELRATPQQGARFVKWTGYSTSTENPLKVTVSGNKSYMAIFEKNGTYTITVVSNDPNMGTVSGGGSYAQGATITIGAYPNTNYKFSRWQDGNTQNPRSITVDGNKTYTAYFSYNGSGGNTYTINDVVGTYSASVYNWDRNQWRNWNGMTISRLNESLEGFTTPVLVEGFDEHTFLLAIGDWDQTNQCIRLKASWGMTSRTFYFTDAPDTNLYARFYPVYAGSNGANDSYWLSQYSNGDVAEVLLKYNSSGQLVLMPAEQADENGRYANGFSWRIYYAADDSDYPLRYDAFTNLTMTKTSSKSAHNTNHVSKAPNTITKPILRPRMGTEKTH